MDCRHKKSRWKALDTSGAGRCGLETIAGGLSSAVDVCRPMCTFGCTIIKYRPYHTNRIAIDYAFIMGILVWISVSVLRALWCRGLGCRANLRPRWLCGGCRLLRFDGLARRRDRINQRRRDRSPP